MSSLAVFIILVVALGIVMIGSYVLVVRKYYWWGRGAPPPTDEEKRRQREEELRMRAEQIEWAKKHPNKPRKESFFDNTKQT